MSSTARSTRSKVCAYVSVRSGGSACRRPAEGDSQFCIICQRKQVPIPEASSSSEMKIVHPEDTDSSEIKTVSISTSEIKEKICVGTTNTGERCTISIKDGIYCDVCKENGPKSIPLQIYPSVYVLPPVSYHLVTPFMAPFYHLLSSTDTSSSEGR